MFMVSQIFQRAIPARQPVAAVALCAAAIVLRLTSEIASFNERKLAAELARATGGDLRLQLVTTVMRSSADSWINQDHRRITARLVLETERIDIMLYRILSAVIPALLSSVVIGIGLVWLSWQLALVGAALAPISLFAQRAVQQRTAKNLSAFRGRAEDFGRDAAFLFSHHTLTHHRGYARQELTRIGGSIDALASSATRMTQSFGRIQAVQTFNSSFIALALAGWGSVLVIKGDMSGGALAAFYVGAVLLATSINQATAALPDLIAGRQSLRQLDEPPFISNDAARQQLGAPCEQVLPIELNAVSVGYGAEVLVADVAMEVLPASTLFIHGDNGSGKTTLVETILGLREPMSGEITAAAMRYDSLDLESLRRRVGYVSQRPMLFQGSIRDNLRYGRPSATDDELNRVLGVAGATTWVQDLPNGIDTFIGDTGSRLSGGQAQSIAIARGLVGEPELLVLDEPGNHLAVGVLPRVLDQIRLAYPRLAIIVVSHGLRGFVPTGSTAEHIGIDERTLVRLDSSSAVTH